MTDDPARAAPPGRPLRRGVEFALFYVGVPVAAALYLPSEHLFSLLGAGVLLALWLLHLTPGFRWAELWQGWRSIAWRRVALWAFLTGAVGLALVLALRPDRLFVPARTEPWLLAAAIAFYPLGSALPQEIVFRALFFHRYAPILPRDVKRQVGLNATLFSLAHLLYWSPTVAAMTFAGGLVFAWSYRVRRNFAEAVVMHATAGIMVFAVGLGIFFYAGNVTRPF